jgi:hypothetical protein
VKVDKGLASAQELIGLAQSLVHLKPKHVTFLTMNTLPDPIAAYSTHLIAEQPQDDILFQLLRTGELWHGHLPTVAPAKVQVRVVNATGQSGLARRTANKLRALGFDVLGVGSATAYTSTTTVQFSGEVNAEAALTVMKALKSFPAGQNELAEPASQIGTPGPVTLVLGADFAGVTAPTVGASPSPSASGKSGSNKGGNKSGSTTVAAANNGPTAVQSRNGGANICSGLPPPLHGK